MLPLVGMGYRDLFTERADYRLVADDEPVESDVRMIRLPHASDDEVAGTRMLDDDFVNG